MLTGRRPFARAQTPAALLTALLTLTPQPPSMFAAIPPAVASGWRPTSRLTSRLTSRPWPAIPASRTGRVPLVAAPGGAVALVWVALALAVLAAIALTVALI